MSGVQILNVSPGAPQYNRASDNGTVITPADGRYVIYTDEQDPVVADLRKGDTVTAPPGSVRTRRSGQPLLPPLDDGVRRVGYRVEPHGENTATVWQLLVYPTPGGLR